MTPLGKFIIINIDQELKPIILSLIEKHGDATFDNVDITKKLANISDSELVQLIKKWFADKGAKF